MDADTALESRGQRFERVFQSFREIYRHDLPNQLVVLQGLVELLDLEEGSQLSEAGREYLLRLKRVSQKALGFSRYIKELVQAALAPEPCEVTALGRFCQELILEARREHPAALLKWDCQFKVEKFVGCRVGLQKALLELIRGLLARGPVLKIIWQAERTTDEVVFCWICPEVQSLPESRWKEVLEFALARELLSGWGARLHAQPARDMRFVLHLPERFAHG